MHHNVQRPTVRRIAVLLVMSTLVVCLGGKIDLRDAQARDEVRRGVPENPMQRRNRRRAIKRGCDFLASKQRTDGGWGENRVVVALTSLTVLALMSNGSTDGRGPHGKQVRKGIDFLLRIVEGKEKRKKRWHEGYFDYPQDNTSRMHGQGYATLALATALGTSSSERYNRIKSVLKKAVACIEYAQTTTGGFGYKPMPSADHEGSVTVAVAQGLRAARDAGILINSQVVRKGLHYLKRSQKRDGSFKYSTHQDQSTYALTAAALSSFYLYGEYSEKEVIAKGISYMKTRLRSRGPDLNWYYYGHFYAAWTAWQHDGHTWEKRGTENFWAFWQDVVYTDLLEQKQREDGSFYQDNGRYNFGPVLSTAFAVLTLAIPDEVVPIFQR